MPIHINKYILRFDIPIDNTQPMQMLNPKQDLHHIEPGHVLRHPFEPFDVREELAARAVFEDEHEEVCALEGEFQLEDEWVGDFGHDVALVLHDSLFVVLGDEVLVDQFHGVEFAVLFEADEEHFGKAAGADALYDIEAFHIDFLLFASVVGPKHHSLPIQKARITILLRQIKIISKISGHRNIRRNILIPTTQHLQHLTNPPHRQHPSLPILPIHDYDLTPILPDGQLGRTIKRQPLLLVTARYLFPVSFERHRSLDFLEVAVELGQVESRGV